MFATGLASVKSEKLNIHVLLYIYLTTVSTDYKLFTLYSGPWPIRNPIYYWMLKIIWIFTKHFLMWAMKWTWNNIFHVQRIILNFIKILAGFCSQFNSNGSIEANSAGISGGVTFILNTLVDEYSTGPYSYSEGFFVSGCITCTWSNQKLSIDQNC